MRGNSGKTTEAWDQSGGFSGSAGVGEKETFVMCEFGHLLTLLSGYRQRPTFSVRLPGVVQGRAQVSVSKTPETVPAQVPKSPGATQAPESPRAQEVVQNPVSGTQEVIQSAGAPRARELPHAPENSQIQATRKVLKDSQAQVVPKAPMLPAATPLPKGLPLTRPQQ